METLTSRISSVHCQTKGSLSLDGDAVVVCREFLDELQKVRRIPVCERQCLPRISVKKLIDALKCNLQFSGG